MSSERAEPESGPVQRVFISYRRQDSAAYAGRLYDAMIARFGDNNVFMDLDLAPGVDFVERITEAVSACQVLIEVIGPTWATVKDEEGQIRIADPEDFVRLELEIALRRPEVTVIPVLVSEAQMPDRRDLPPELVAMARRNALELSDRRWRYDVGRLVSALEEILAGTSPIQLTPTTGDQAAMGGASRDAAPTDHPQIPSRPADRGRPGGWLRRHRGLLAGVAALALLGVVVAVVALGGGSGGGATTSFQRFTGADAFKSVEVPAGWRARQGDVDRDFSGPTGTGVTTTLTAPDGKGLVEIAREEASPVVEDHARDVLRVRINRDDATPSNSPTQETVAGGLAWLIEYKWIEEGLGPATVATYLFNDAGSGWRTRAALPETSDSAARAEEIAKRMAATLEP